MSKYNRSYLTIFTLPLISMTALPVKAETANSFEDMVKGGTVKVAARYRYEVVSQDGINQDAKASTLKTRLTWSSAHYNNFYSVIEVDNVSYLGDDAFNSTTNGRAIYPKIADPKGTDINQAYLGYQANGLTLSAGRQRINHNNQRFIGGVGWRQNEQTFDGVRLQYQKTKKLQLDYSYIYNVNRIFGPSGTKSDLKGDISLLNVKYQLADQQKLSLFSYTMDFDDNAALSNTTSGLSFDGKLSAINIHTSYAIQKDTGNNAASYEAHYWTLDLGTNIAGVGLHVGVESLGGDKGKGFITPLATLHKFQGWGDKFLATPDSGLEDLYIKASKKFNRLALSTAWHVFNAEQGSADYGTELDISLAYSLSDNTSLLIKYASFDADELATDTNKLWLMASMKF
jgi:hypothetical protein